MKTESPTTRLAGSGLRVGYDQRTIIHELDLAIPDDSFTVIVGPNACGKSTLLRALARLLKPTQGHVLLDGQEITRYPSKEVAKRIGLLPQTSIAPDGISVIDLVSRGRYPHQSILKRWSAADEVRRHHPRPLGRHGCGVAPRERRRGPADHRPGRAAGRCGDRDPRWHLPHRPAHHAGGKALT